MARPDEVARRPRHRHLGISTQSGAHQMLVPQGAGDIVVTVGGIIPSKDYTMLETAARQLLELLSRSVDRVWT